MLVGVSILAMYRLCGPPGAERDLQLHQRYCRWELNRSRWNTIQSSLSPTFAAPFRPIPTQSTAAPHKRTLHSIYLRCRRREHTAVESRSKSQQMTRRCSICTTYLFFSTSLHQHRMTGEGTCYRASAAPEPRSLRYGKRLYQSIASSALRS
jgi:hypothetical protein